MNTTLEARVKAKNRANAKANELYKVLEPIFRPLVGQKVFRADGGVLKKVENLIDRFTGYIESQRIRIYRYTSEYSVVYNVNVWENVVDRNHCIYEESSVYVGSVHNGVLVSISEPPALREDYKAEDVERAREEYQKAQKVADNLKMALFPFGEYDR